MNRLTLFLCACLLPAPSVLAANLFMLVGRDADVQPVQLIIISPEEVEVMHENTGFNNLPRENCIALLRPTLTPGVSNKPHLQLRDGQVFPGRPMRLDDPGFIYWEHVWLGSLRIPTEHVDRIVLDPADSIQGPEDLDRVVLKNGDVLDGFVASLNDPLQIEVENDAGETMMTIPWDRLRLIDLFGDPEPPADPRVWTNDGTIATLSSIELGADSYLRIGDHSFRVGGQSNKISGPNIRDIHSLALSSQGMTPLSALKVSSITTSSTQLKPYEPMLTDKKAPLGLSPIEFRGPVTVKYELPPGPQRLLTTVRMPRGSRSWGDCELLIRVDDVDILREKFNESHHEARLDLPVQGAHLEIQLLEGANGPVQDHLRLEYALLLKQ